MPEKIGSVVVEHFEIFAHARDRLRELAGKAAESAAAYSLTLQPVGWFAYRVRVVRTA